MSDDAARQHLDNLDGKGQGEQKPTSLGKMNVSGNERSDTDEPGIPIGYQEIHPEYFPSKGLFYRKSLRFFIRPASANEIRHFSAIDENDAESVDEGLGQLLNGCLEIRGEKRRHSYRDLLDEDRIYVILEIRALTFAKGENNIVIPVECSSCETLNQIKLDNSILEFKDHDERILKYLNPETGVVEVKTKSFGTINLYPATIGVASKVLSFAMSQRRSGKKIDTTFIKMVPYLISDWRQITEKTISSIFQDYLAWSKEKLTLMINLCDMMRAGVSENLKSECTKCQASIEAPVTFPDGFKSLFVVSDISGELL